MINIPYVVRYANLNYADNITLNCLGVNVGATLQKMWHRCLAESRLCAKCGANGGYYKSIAVEKSHTKSVIW